MSDSIKHECGIALVRLLKPLDYYHKKYGNARYGIDKMHLLMQKQRNRGQDGAGIATIKLNVQPGQRYISRKRSNEKNPLNQVFDGIYKHFEGLKPKQLNNVKWLKKNVPYTGELLLGHLRYGTHGANSIETVHPQLRQNNWISRNLVLAGNFNLTNSDELFKELIELGQYPKEKSDTITMLEKIGHFLDDEIQRLYTWYKPEGYSNTEINKLIIKNLDVQRLLRRATKKIDGGFVLAGLIGHGDAFVLRDPSGIRPAYFYHDDEVLVVASERPAIQTAFGVNINKVQELKPAHAIICKADGRINQLPYSEERKRRSCSFERIYFSRGTDRDIYLERKKLGYQLAKRVLKEVDYDFKNTVFSFVPNTAESAFYGLVEGANDILNQYKIEKISQLKTFNDKQSKKQIEDIIKLSLRVEKVIIKDEKLRTFIANENSRGTMVSHGYDVTYGIINNEVDTLVLIDDSIVRGTTLRDSILTIAARLKPKKILVVSSAPQIRYPDCYGIDMSRMNEFVAFQALVHLLKKDGKEKLLQKAYKNCKKQENLPVEKITNQVFPLFELYSDKKISQTISKIVTPETLKPEVKVIFQSIKALHKACPDNNGDWYFTGKYPTPGGNRVVNRAFINYIDNINDRPY